MFIIIYGDVINGLRFVGPFTSRARAVQYLGPDWHECQCVIAPITLPPDGDE